MKTKIIGACLLASVALVGCNTNDNNEEGMGLDNNPVEQTRYNEDMNELNNEVEHQDGVNQKSRYQKDQVGVKNGQDNKDMNNNDDQYDVSKKAADRINKDVDGIDGAYVIMTKNNAYVAANMDKNDSNKSGEDLTDATKKKIKKIVKDTENDIDNVYVSTDPDFSNLINNYSDNVNNGKPVRGMFDQMGNMIERLFPENK